MKLFMVFAISAMAILSNVSAQAGVVLLSNMGDSGLQDTSSGSSYDNTGVTRYASGFHTGLVAQQLSWASLVVATNSTAGSRTVSIYGSSAEEPSRPFGTALATSNSIFVDTKNVYTFGFNNFVLQADTTYWIVPDNDLRWYTNQDEETPGPIDNSGYSFVGASRSLTSGSSWESFSDGTFTLSIATPEPSLTILLCLGGIGLIRRRAKR